MENFPPASRTWAEVDLAAVRRNVRTLRRRAGGTPLMAVVKADAYGHGAVPVARAALEAGADALAVVTAEEGAQLREAGLGAPILVFTDLAPTKLLLARRLRLTATAHSVGSAKRIAAVEGLPAHLKVNTGMNRWGVEPSEVGEARKVLGDHLAGVYTHFACADSDAAETRRQKERFDAVLADQPFGGLPAHAANSAAVLWHPETRYDLVRPGISLYGLHPKGDEGNPAEEGLSPAMKLGSHVAHVRRLSPGDGVSYGFTFRVDGPTLAATVPVGYAEGYQRQLSGSAYALIRGKRRPLLGRVTMDACVFGVDEGVEAGDEVVLLGGQDDEKVSAEELGRLAGTINYAFTTGINPRRVERSYKDVRGS